MGRRLSLSRYWAPDQLLFECGIFEPQDIDPYYIAEKCGARVREASLTGCDARIIGLGGNAIIKISNTLQPTRKRFSIGHEIGHWVKRHGQDSAFRCEPAKGFQKWLRDGFDLEKQADQFAAQLLMPKSMFQPLIAEEELDFRIVRELKETFKTSLSATAIRTIELCQSPAMLVITQGQRRKWFTRGPEISEELFPTEYPGHQSLAVRAMQGEHFQASEIVPASCWFDIPEAEDHEIVEDVVSFEDTTMSILWWHDEEAYSELCEQIEARLG